MWLNQKIKKISYLQDQVGIDPGHHIICHNPPAGFPFLDLINRRRFQNIEDPEEHKSPDPDIKRFGKKDHSIEIPQKLIQDDPLIISLHSLFSLGNDHHQRDGQQNRKGPETGEFDKITGEDQIDPKSDQSPKGTRCHRKISGIENGG